MKIKLTICLLLLSPPIVFSQALPAPTIEKVWLEKQSRSPNGQIAQQFFDLPASSYSFADGLYKSVASRISLKIPRVGEEKTVSVRESLISLRPDGSAITTHLIFTPGALSAAPDKYSAASAVVVTRLRDDRPKDKKSVLSRWQPSTPEQRVSAEKEGTFYSLVDSPFGEAVERVTLNRVFDLSFPYTGAVVTDSKLRTVGISRIAVADSDSLIEFSQIFPCGTLSATDCRSAATKVADGFVAGVEMFKTYPPEDAPASK